MLALKRPQPRAGVLEIEPYMRGGNATPQGATVFKLSSNETPLGPSLNAVCAYHETAKHLAVYPDGSGTALRAVIGRAYALNPALIVCGAGSDELLNLLARAFLGPGDEAIHTVHGFLVFRTATLSAGGRPVVVPESNYTADVDAILSAVTPRTKCPIGQALGQGHAAHLEAHGRHVVDARGRRQVGSGRISWHERRNAGPRLRSSPPRSLADGGTFHRLPAAGKIGYSVGWNATGPTTHPATH
jgi:hypothetical protein